MQEQQDVSMLQSSHLSFITVYSSLHLLKHTQLHDTEEFTQTPFEDFIDNVWSFTGLLSWEEVLQQVSGVPQE